MCQLFVGFCGKKIKIKENKTIPTKSNLDYEERRV